MGGSGDCDAQATLRGAGDEREHAAVVPGREKRVGPHALLLRKQTIPREQSRLKGRGEGEALVRYILIPCPIETSSRGCPRLSSSPQG